MTTTTTSAPAVATTTTLDAARRFEEVWAMTPSPHTSCLVVVRGDGILADHNGMLPVVPASTVKLLVAAAAPGDPRVPAILRDSDNDAARALVDDLGGLDAVRAVASEDGIVVRDATGHDRGNRVTCWTLVRILREHDFRDDLAVAGESGTLRDRFVEHRGLIRAKTGSIRGVGALAGYAGDVEFAHVLNDTGDPTPIQDALVDALVG